MAREPSDAEKEIARRIRAAGLKWGDADYGARVDEIIRVFNRERREARRKAAVEARRVERAARLATEEGRAEEKLRLLDRRIARANRLAALDADGRVSRLEAKRKAKRVWVSGMSPEARQDRLERRRLARLLRRLRAADPDGS